MWRRIIFSAPRMKWRRLQLRSNQTKAEILLWEKLRRNNFKYKFKRQFSIDNYVVDFYCPKKKLAVEVDGLIHQKRLEYDEYRSAFLKQMGVSELRFTNKLVLENMQIVLTAISHALSYTKGETAGFDIGEG